MELPPPAVAHRAAADVAVLAEIVKALADVAGVDMQGMMTLDCHRKYKGTFQIYEGKALVDCKCTNRVCQSSVLDAACCAREIW